MQDETIQKVITTLDTKPPKVLMDVNISTQCVFCKRARFDSMYLYTRKQIHVCFDCDKVLDELIGTNHK